MKSPHTGIKRILKAFAYSYDGFKATFNLFTNNLNHEDPGSIQGSELAELYKGHEIACHAYHHPHLERMTISAQYEEIIKEGSVSRNGSSYDGRSICWM